MFYVAIAYLPIMMGGNSGDGRCRASVERAERVDRMADDDMPGLRARAASGDHDAVDQLVELAGERGDLDELRRLADAGSGDAADLLSELAEEDDGE